jgi:hypothetical protein
MPREKPLREQIDDLAYRHGKTIADIMDFVTSIISRSADWVNPDFEQKNWLPTARVILAASDKLINSIDRLRAAIDRHSPAPAPTPTTPPRPGGMGPPGKSVGNA